MALEMTVLKKVAKKVYSTGSLIFLFFSRSAHYHYRLEAVVAVAEKQESVSLICPISHLFIRPALWLPGSFYRKVEDYTSRQERNRLKLGLR